MRAEELREKFIRFFVERGHKELPAASLIPENDPSVLFTTAGMQQFKKFYLHPEEALEKFGSKNVVTIQPCLRTSDIDEVGDNSHLTFFEMLGNFSFGGYDKKEAIKYAWEFLTEALKIDKDRISATYYNHNKASGPMSILFDKTDEESFKELRKYLDESKISSQGDDNFWTLGTVGSPGGPTVEFYVDDIEVWNIVFNEAVYKGNHWHWFRVDSKGDYHLGIDTGMGLERMLAVLENQKDIYKTELFRPIIQRIEEISGKKYKDCPREFRILADHMKAMVLIMAAGVVPSNTERGSVLRRLIRDSEDIAIDLNFKAVLFLNKLAQQIIKENCKYYPDLEDTEKFIYKILMNELTMHRIQSHRLLPKINKRIKILERDLNKRLDLKEDADPKWFKAAFISPSDSISVKAGKFAYHLWNTNRCSKEYFWSQLDSRIKDSINKDEFEKGFEEAELKFKNISRAGIEKKFKGGLVGESEITTRMHTTTHLLLKALQEVLGPDVHQKGSNINEERIRFDFSYDKPMTDEEIKKVEEIVNQKIKENLPVIKKSATVEEAKKMGAEATFIEKYQSLGKDLTMYSIDDFSHELCGGPHVKHTGEIGKFKIIKEESSSAGVRRIKAVLE
jgi:alanyl-tRNA synthetase